MSHIKTIPLLRCACLIMLAVSVITLVTGCESDASIKKHAADSLVKTGNETLARLDTEFQAFDKEFLDNKARIMQLERAAEPAFKWIEGQRAIAEAELWTPRDITWQEDLGPLKNFLYELKIVRFIIDPGSPAGTCRYSIIVSNRTVEERGEFNVLSAKYRANITAMTPQRNAMLQKKQRLAAIIRTIGENASLWTVAEPESNIRLINGSYLGIDSSGTLAAGAWRYDAISGTMTPADPAADALQNILDGK